MNKKRRILNRREIATFQKKILSQYKQHKRKLPWRKTKNPYHILVSEIMLQQTQVERVVEKYKQFIQKFPTLESLAHATSKDLLTTWSGLGYNRRALFLQKAAQKIVHEYHGTVPHTKEELCTLPGIGPATAAAVMAYTFNLPVVFIETNIRTVCIHSFFKNQKEVHDRDILPLMEQTLDRKNPRQWYNALMDYGTMLKGKYPNPNRRSAHHIQQSPFQGSHRQLRGQVLKVLLAAASLSKKELIPVLNTERKNIEHTLTELEKEGFIRIKKGNISLR